MELIWAWVFFCVIVAVLANKRHRNSVGWFLIALFLSPLIAGLLVLAMGDAKKSVVAVGDELTKLATLRDTGHLTPEEFERQKAVLLGTQKTAAPEGTAVKG